MKKEVQWRTRRRIILCSFIFCHLILLWLITFGDDTNTIHTTILMPLITYMGGIATFYMGIKSYTDYKNKKIENENFKPN